MVVEQEMAEIYPPYPEDLCEFLPETDCAKCGYMSCMEFAAAILKVEVDAQKCSDLNSEFAQLLNSVAQLKKDPIPYNVMMEQEPCNLIEVNAPNEKAPLLITCNFRQTVAIMKEILEKTSNPCIFAADFHPWLFSRQRDVRENVQSHRSLESNSRKRSNRKDRACPADNPRSGGIGKEFDQTVDQVGCPRGPEFRISYTAVLNGQWVMVEQGGLEPKFITGGKKMLLKNYRLDIFNNKCMPGAETVNCFAHLDEDVSAVLPYLNSVLGGFEYVQDPPAVTFKAHGKLITVHGRRIAVNALKDEAEACKVVDWLKREINETWENRDSIPPSTKGASRPMIIEILKLLPKTNCRECGEPTCMVFATRLAEGVWGAGDCPAMEADNRQRLEQYLSRFHFDI